MRCHPASLLPHSFPMFPHKLCCHMRQFHVQVLVVVVEVGGGWGPIFLPATTLHRGRYCYYTPPALRWQVQNQGTPRLQPEEDAPVTASYFEPQDAIASGPPLHRGRRCAGPVASPGVVSGDPWRKGPLSRVQALTQSLSPITRRTTRRRASERRWCAAACSAHG